MGKIVAVLNQKGGVGKTTSTINIAAFLAKAKKTVLIIDLDPQGNATSGLGLEKNNLDATISEVLLGSATLDRAIKELNNGVAIVPANANLAGTELALVEKANREHCLKSALGNVVYDYVLIDCPPALGVLTINALTAADHVLIPVQAEYYALEGLSQLLGVIQMVRGGLNPSLELLGVVVTMYDGRTSLSDSVYSELKKHFAGKVFETVVPRNVRLAEAPSYGKTIADHDKWSKGARAYKNIAKEFERRLRI
jgi:chromosome partitioning protein